MKYRLLGKTGLKVSEIGLGCSGFWGNRRFPEAKALSVVHAAFEHGINFFDTGHNYSNYNAEPRLGRALAEILRQHDRSKIVVSTKAGTVRPRIAQHTDELDYKNFSPDYIEETCAQSIKNLNCDYIDIFQLHAIPPKLITQELLTRLSSMKQKGMFRLLGINTHREADILHVAGMAGVFDMILIDFNVLQIDRVPLIEKLHAAGVAVMVGTVLAQGHLVQGKIGRLGRMADVWYLARALLRPEGRVLAKVAPPMRKTLSAILGMTQAQAATAYALSVPSIASCIVGTTDIRNLNEIADASDLTLSDEAKARIRSTFDAQRVRVSR